MEMCNLKAAQIYELPFKAAKEPVQSTAWYNLFLPYSKKKVLSVISSLTTGAS